LKLELISLKPILLRNHHRNGRLPLRDLVYELNFELKLPAKPMNLQPKNPDKPRFVAGSIGPTNRTASMSPDVNDPDTEP
jgi:methionine synthase I (cobalamin-dependent)